VRLNDDGTAKSIRRLRGRRTSPRPTRSLVGSSIGDYIEVFAHNRTAWVGYNANYRSRAVLFEGLPIPQQDKLPGQGAGVAVAWLGRRVGPRWTGAFIHRLPQMAVTHAVKQPEGAGRYGVRPPSSSAPLGIRRSQAWNRSTSRTDPTRAGLPRNPYG
jgi:hypothetical protein